MPRRWLVVAVMLSVGISAILLTHRVARRWDGVPGSQRSSWRPGHLLFAIVLVVVPLAIESSLYRIIGLRFEAFAITSKILLIFAHAAAVVILLAFVELVAQVVISSRRARVTDIDAQFIRVTARVLAVVGSLLLILKAADFPGVELTPVLAGLGIGGLALALAARPTLENVIGGMTLFVDKPVRVGDFCQFGKDEGTVEEIGVRSTRIRKREWLVYQAIREDINLRIMDIVKGGRYRLCVPVADGLSCPGWGVGRPAPQRRGSPGRDMAS